jgi:hypothetical protein
MTGVIESKGNRMTANSVSKGLLETDNFTVGGKLKVQG